MKKSTETVVSYLLWIVVIIVGSAAFIGCSEEPRDRQLRIHAEDEAAYWMDSQHKSHAKHTIRFIGNVRDTTAVDEMGNGKIVGYRYYCVTDSAMFAIPEPRFMVARRSDGLETRFYNNTYSR